MRVTARTGALAACMLAPLLAYGAWAFGGVSGGPTGGGGLNYGQAHQSVLSYGETLTVGAPCYVNASHSVKLARADAAATATVLGVCAVLPGTIQADGIVTATTAQWDAVAGTSGGLAFGVVYYLDASAPGRITSTAPSTPGQFVVELGVALSSTEFCLRVQKAAGL